MSARHAKRQEKIDGSEAPTGFAFMSHMLQNGSRWLSSEYIRLMHPSASALTEPANGLIIVRGLLPFSLYCLFSCETHSLYDDGYLKRPIALYPSKRFCYGSYYTAHTCYLYTFLVHTIFSSRCLWRSTYIATVSVAANFSAFTPWRLL